MIYIKNKIIPFGKNSIMLFGIVFYKSKTLSGVTMRHEEIHLKQLKETGFILYYPLYILLWILTGFNYYKIPFEQEAYTNQYDYKYLDNRKPYSWIKYFKKFW